MAIIGPSEDSVTRLLDRVDWDFPGATTLEQSIHSLHWFPGNFIPEIPSYLIEILSQPGDVVLDPFCGSGTTGVEALRLGRRAIISDINRASIEVARGKISAYDVIPYISRFYSLAQSLIWDSLLRSSAVGTSGEGSNPNLRDWIEQDTLAQLKFLWMTIEGIENSAIYNVARMLFSDTLFACASTGGAKTGGGKRRRHHWGWVADNVRPSQLFRHNAISMFRDRLLRAIDVLTLIPDRQLGRLAQVSRNDARKLALDDSSVDLIVTSPPYLGMIDYALANRLSYLWYGWPLEEDKNMEIGARYRRRRLDTIPIYLKDMTKAFSEMRRCLKEGGYLALVIGASRAYPQVVEGVFGAATMYFQPVWGPIPRVPTRRRISDRRGADPKEFILIFRRTK